MQPPKSLVAHRPEANVDGGEASKVPFKLICCAVVELDPTTERYESFSGPIANAEAVRETVPGPAPSTTVSVSPESTSRFATRYCYSNQ